MRLIGIVAGAAVLSALGACGSDQSAASDRKIARLTDRAPVAPSDHIGALSRRVAARVERVIGAEIPGGLRIAAVQSDRTGVTFSLIVDAADAVTSAPNPKALAEARHDLADRSCALMSPLERALLKQGAEIRYRYLPDAPAAAYELALRREDCVGRWERAPAWREPVGAQ